MLNSMPNAEQQNAPTLRTPPDAKHLAPCKAVNKPRFCPQKRAGRRYAGTEQAAEPFRSSAGVREERQGATAAYRRSPPWGPAPAPAPEKREGRYLLRDDVAQSQRPHACRRPCRPSRTRRQRRRHHPSPTPNQPAPGRLENSRGKVAGSLHGRRGRRQRARQARKGTSSCHAHAARSATRETRSPRPPAAFTPARHPVLHLPLPLPAEKKRKGIIPPPLSRCSATARHAVARQSRA